MLGLKGGPLGVDVALDGGLELGERWEEPRAGTTAGQWARGLHAHAIQEALPIGERPRGELGPRG